MITNSDITQAVEQHRQRERQRQSLIVENKRLRMWCFGLAVALVALFVGTAWAAWLFLETI